MKTNDLCKLIKVAEDSSFTELEIRDGKQLVRIVRSSNIPPGVNVISAPLDGVFYRSPSSKAEWFVHVGQRVSEGDPLCIISADGITNQIESNQTGIIQEIQAENGMKVEQGQPLFVIKPEE